jgi:hypothetical protein
MVKTKVKIRLEPLNPSTERVIEIEEDYSESSEEENDSPDLDEDKSLIKRKDTDDDE